MNNLMCLSPDQKYMWFADYIDGASVNEFYKDGDTIKKNELAIVDKDRLKKFGLLGMGNKVYFDSIGGTFFLSGRMISVKITDEEGNKYPINGLGSISYNDIIQYKQAISQLVIRDNVKVQEPVISGYYFGFKGKPTINEVDFSYKCIFCINMNQPASLDLTLNSSKDFVGKLEFCINGKPVEEFDIEFKDNKSYRMNWVVKFG